MLEKHDKQFRTANFHLAVFLICKGQMEIVSIEATPGSRRQTFVFTDIPERSQLVQNYTFGQEDTPETMVDARKFVTATRLLKDKLYQSSF